ncbi:MAG: sulfite exporter TauE/SafE family protein [Terriglobia bacterium]
MNTAEFTLVIGLGALAAGFLGALTGLGGGIVVTPLLTLAFGVNIRYAMGASLVSVIATSSGAAAAYVKEGLSNIRAGMFLEIATTIGAVVGAAITLELPTTVIGIVFGVVLLYSAFQSTRIHPELTTDDRPQDRISRILRMDSTYPAIDGLKSYRVHSVPGGFGVMFGAGILSGLLGIGSGALKVVAMDQVMRLPFKVSTTTSNFMIGVTAAASAGVYLRQGYVDPGLAMPVMLGVLLGALLGARILPKTRSNVLRVIFAIAVTVLAVEMIYHGLAGRL